MQERYACEAGNGRREVIVAARNAGMSERPGVFDRFAAFKIDGG